MSSHRRFLASLSLLTAVLVAAPAAAQRMMSGAYPESYYRTPEPSVLRAFMMQEKEMEAEPLRDRPAMAAAACAAGDASGYPCSNVDLLAFMPLDDIGGGGGNDIWGWTDPQTGREYAIMGRTNGTAFVDLGDPENPIYLGNLATHTESSTWRDIKVYADHAFIVSEADDHGMQVFDLTQLRSVAAPPVEFSETTHYGDFGSAHNIVINEDSGFAYGVGTNTCAGGLHVVNIQNPTAPTFANCFDSDGYTHDAQCVTYTGPDAAHSGREICLAFNEDTLTVVDMTDKSAPLELSRTGYSNRGYTHQGWFDEGQRWVFMNDELDERNSGISTRTLVWDLADLDAPVHSFSHDHGIAAADHNLYVKGSYIYESNYRAGLRILDMSCADSGSLVEVGYFDIYPDSDSSSFTGTWSNYPWYASGIVAVSGIGEGLFILRPNLDAAAGPPVNFAGLDTGSNQVDLSWDDVPGSTGYSIQRSANGCAGPWFDLDTSPTASYSDTTVSGGVTYGYLVRSANPLGCVSACIEVVATGDCILPPSFDGARALVNPFIDGCELEVRWDAATGACSPDVVYNVYRDTVSGFTPDAGNRVASCLSGSTWSDDSVVSGTRYHYVVRAEDRQAVGSGPCGGFEETNALELSGSVVSDSVLDQIADGAEAALLLTFDTPWEVSSADAQSGTQSFRIPGDDARTCASLEMPAFVATNTSVLSYAHREQDIEDEWDGGTVEISVDAGQSWAKLDPDQGYPSTMDSRSISCNNFGGGGFYSDDSNGFDAATVDLSPWAGQEVVVRFRFATDRRVDSTAWFIDDVLVTDVAVGQCGAAGSWQLYRATLAGLPVGWKAGVPLPLAPGPSIDPGWPWAVSAPNTETDLGALVDPEPLMLYRVLDDVANPVGNRLRLVRSGADDVAISF